MFTHLQGISHSLKIFSYLFLEVGKLIRTKKSLDRFSSIESQPKKDIVVVVVFVVFIVGHRKLTLKFGQSEINKLGLNWVKLGSNWNWD